MKKVPNIGVANDRQVGTSNAAVLPARKNKKKDRPTGKTKKSDARGKVSASGQRKLSKKKQKLKEKLKEKKSKMKNVMLLGLFSF